MCGRVMGRVGAEGERTTSPRAWQAGGRRAGSRRAGAVRLVEGRGVQTAGSAGRGARLRRHAGMALVLGLVGDPKAEAWPWRHPQWAERALALLWVAGDTGGSQERW